MNDSLLLSALAPPYMTASLAGIGGVIKADPEDFEVEEIPAYLPSGEGDFLYLWLEKRDMGAGYFQRQIATRLGIPPGEIGSAGLKDRRAVTRQWISVPKAAEAQLPKLEGDGIRVLSVSRHGNKLRAGHLHGNRFRLLIRSAGGAEQGGRPSMIAAPVLDAVKAQGLPNFYGPQRFGRDAETLNLGLQLLQGDAPRVRNPFLKKLALSAVQSALFNVYLARRMEAGLLHTVLEGDVMCKLPRGGMFVAQDVAAEQARFDQREIVPAGPILGVKTFAAASVAAQHEEELAAAVGLDPAAFGRFRKLMPGTRRHNLIFLDDLASEQELEGLRLSFSLPAGSYATVLLREVMKSPAAEEADEAAP